MNVKVILTVKDARTDNGINTASKEFELPFLMSSKDGLQKSIHNPDIVKWVLRKKNRLSNYVEVLIPIGDKKSRGERYLVQA